MSILITGASAGFGEAMCRTFVAAGYQVIGAARRLDKLQGLQAELGERADALGRVDVGHAGIIQGSRIMPPHA